MEKIQSVLGFEKCSGTCEKIFRAKFDGSDGKRAILICGGPGCLANDSKGIMDEFIKLIAENSIEERVVSLQDEKKELVDKVISNDDSSIKKLSIKDLKSILNM